MDSKCTFHFKTLLKEKNINYLKATQLPSNWKRKELKTQEPKIEYRR